MASLSPGDVTSSYVSACRADGRVSCRKDAPLKLVSTHLVMLDPSRMDEGPSNKLAWVPPGLSAWVMGMRCLLPS